MMTVPMLLPVLAVTPMMMLLSVLVLVPVPFVIMLLIVIMPMVISVVLAVVVPVLAVAVAVAVTAAVTVTMAESGGMRQNPAQGCVPDNAGLLVGGDELDFRASARGWLLPRG